MTLKEVAKYLGLSERAVARHREAGRLNVRYADRKEGGTIGIYDRDQVEALKEQLANPVMRVRSAEESKALTARRSASIERQGVTQEQLESLAAQHARLVAGELAKGVGRALASQTEALAERVAEGISLALAKHAEAMAEGVGRALASHAAQLGGGTQGPTALPAASDPPEPAPNLIPLADKLILSLREAARLSGLSYDRLKAACEAKKLKAQRDTIGRGWRIKRADLEAYVRKL